MLDLSNRELASLICMALLVALAPRAFAGVVRAFLAPRLLAVMLVLYAYLAGCVWVLAQVGLWRSGLLSQTVVWAAVSGFAVLFASLDAGRERGYYRRAVAAACGVNLFIAFVVSLVSFQLWLEVVLQIVAATVITLRFYIGTDEQFAPARPLVDWMVAIVGFVYLAGTARLLWQQWDTLDGGLVWRSLMLANLLPILALPYVFTLTVLHRIEHRLMHCRLRMANGRG